MSGGFSSFIGLSSASGFGRFNLLGLAHGAPVAIGGDQFVRAEERKAQGGKNRQDQD